MNQTQISEMADALIRRGVVATENRAKTIRVLSSLWDYKKAFIWGTDDVHAAANRAGRAISDNDASSILDRAFDNHDASVGINWSVLEIHIGGLGRKMTDDEIDQFVANGEPVKA